MFIFQSLYRKPENRFLIYNPVCFILTGDFWLKSKRKTSFVLDEEDNCQWMALFLQTI